MDIKNLAFSYDRNQPFINLKHLEIPDGKVTTIIGPNGSGKSTLLSLIAGLLKPNSGDIYLGNQKVADLSAKELAKKLAVVHQQNEAPSHYTVRQLVNVGRYPHRKGLAGMTEADEVAIDTAIQQTALGKQEACNINELSGGQRQRAWLALSLAQDTEYLLLDEPTTYLDLHHQLEILGSVATLNKMHNKTIIMVLHDLNQAMQYSDEVIVMHHGEVVAQGVPEKIMTAELIDEVFHLPVQFIVDQHGQNHMLTLKK
ncbi:MAG: ABC transporter ATP-binding protein [Kurthia sp.]|nr:ABC transporter ATP-binding protein [Candidatus Kurthia equi]